MLRILCGSLVPCLRLMVVRGVWVTWHVRWWIRLMVVLVLVVGCRLLSGVLLMRLWLRVRLFGWLLTCLV